MNNQLESKPSPKEEARRPTPRRGRWWLLIIAVVLPVLLCSGLCCGGLTWWAYETGNYNSKHNIRITNDARDAFFEARKTHPEAVLFIDQYETFAWRAIFERTPQAHRYVVNITERGVPLTVESAGFHSSFDMWKPVITHDGREDKTQGYEVVLKGPAAFHSRRRDFP
jgi:hypothetical protein